MADKKTNAPAASGNLQKNRPLTNRIDDTVDDSFPASDPPQWDSLRREEREKKKKQ